MISNRCSQLLCFCLLLLSAIESNCEYQCSHHGEEKIARVHLRKPGHLAVKRSLTDDVFNQTFRVYAHYDSSFSSGLSSGVQSRIRDIVKNVTDFLRPPYTRQHVAGNFCGHFDLVSKNRILFYF
ncbi:PREDICTED: uncharacterized protein LOC109582827 [Amphimedon queenslandica]|uniref:Secreted protein n=1 Tax=Amphimedon queenslandica TaxID=400682 RepID=A0AAN0J9E1_AMPQE|nr:PREDICTED: uncharacterized protein LOC109582827 [Amphimedon queenslandica]|eukprot:XP_019853367.1 PREDICTED: uncharacterized protein LOC109582827 [Amphimedon queenslandica]